MKSRCSYDSSLNVRKFPQLREAQNESIKRKYLKVNECKQIRGNEA